MATVQLAGTIKRINKTETVGTSGFKKRTFLLLEDKANYPSTWMLETHKDYCSELDKFMEGQIVTCEVEITGREWKDKAFNTLKAYRITSTGAVKPVAAVSYVATEPMDDLPF